MEFFFQQKVIYEWRLTVCSICRKFGHSKHECINKKQEKMVWKVKSKPENREGVQQSTNVERHVTKSLVNMRIENSRKGIM